MPPAPLLRWDAVSSGLIYAVIVGAWAAVLIPMWLRHQDTRALQRAEEDRPRGVRVVSRVGEERRETSRRTRPDPADDLPRLPRPPRRPPGAWAGRPSLAARRRRLLGALTGVTVFATVGALLSVLPVTFLYGCLLLLAGYLVHLRLQARRDAALARRRREIRDRTEARMRRIDSAERVVALRRARDAERALARAGADASGGERAALQEAARIAAARAEEAWEPRTVPLPTYVTQAADRPARTIELASGAWWIAVPAHSDPPAADPTQAGVDEQPAGDTPPRAVNE